MEVKTRQLITIVLPSYNDKDIILPYYKAIVTEIESQDKYDVEMIYVDDGSEDGSQNVLREIAQNDKRVTYIELFCNCGQQRALVAGLEYSSGEYVVTLDGDYQYEPDVVFTLVELLDGDFEMASGIRVSRQDTIWEKFTSKLGNLVIRKTMGASIQDFGSVKAFKRSLVDKILQMRHRLGDVYPSALSLRPKIVEVKVKHKKRYSGKSHWDLWMRLRLYVDLYVIYSKTNFQLPFKIGILTMVAGTGVSILGMLYKFIIGHQASYFQILSFSIIIIFLGFLSMAWSLIMYLLIGIFKQNTFSDPYIIRSVVGKKEEF